MDGFSIKLRTEVYLPLNKETKLNHNPIANIEIYLALFRLGILA